MHSFARLDVHFDKQVIRANFILLQLARSAKPPEGGVCRCNISDTWKLFRNTSDGFISERLIRKTKLSNLCVNIISQKNTVVPLLVRIFVLPACEISDNLENEKQRENERTKAVHARLEPVTLSWQKLTFDFGRPPAWFYTSIMKRMERKKYRLFLEVQNIRALLWMKLTSLQETGHINNVQTAYVATFLAT